MSSAPVQFTYSGALSYLYSFADYERAAGSRQVPAEFNLERTRVLLDVLGNPQVRFPSVLVAGTKGKGSTAAMIATILRSAGLSVGLYSQPHLHTYRERIRVDDELIPTEVLARYVSDIRSAVDETHRQAPALGRLTTYEIGTALAFQYLADKAIDLAVLEVGLGGRLDSTNIVRPLVSVITPISLDHTQILGDTIAQIAAEKAGIIKDKGIVVSAPQVSAARFVIQQTAQARGARAIFVDPDRLEISGRGKPAGDGERGAYRFSFRTQRAHYTDLEVSLRGQHQLLNAATAITVIEELTAQGYRVTAEQVRQGLANVHWPGRLEVLGRSPLVVVDGAHNGDSAACLRHALGDCFEFERLLLLLGTTADKDIAAIVRELVPPADQVFLCRSRHPRAASLETLQRECAEYERSLSVSGAVAAALDAALSAASRRDLVLAAGSLFVVAEVREAMGIAKGED